MSGPIKSLSSHINRSSALNIGVIVLPEASILGRSTEAHAVVCLAVFFWAATSAAKLVDSGFAGSVKGRGGASLKGSIITKSNKSNFYEDTYKVQTRLQNWTFDRQASADYTLIEEHKSYVASLQAN